MSDIIVYPNVRDFFDRRQLSQDSMMVGSPLASVYIRFDQTASGWSRGVYFLKYKSGVSDHHTFARIRVEIYVSDMGPSGGDPGRNLLPGFKSYRIPQCGTFLVPGSYRAGIITIN